MHIYTYKLKYIDTHGVSLAKTGNVKSFYNNNHHHQIFYLHLKATVLELLPSISVREDEQRQSEMFQLKFKQIK